MSDKPQVEADHYRGLSYDTRERFISYWHQADQVLRRAPESVLEVGIGSGFLHRYLRQQGVDVHTLDFDEDLSPDTVGSVLELPFRNKSFDMACCYETLEHLPWENFDSAVHELARVAQRWVVLSLPDVTPYVRMDLEYGDRKRVIRKLCDLPNPKPGKHSFDGQHYWEMGKAGFSRERIRRRLANAGLRVEEEIRVFELPYHYYFACRTRGV